MPNALIIMATGAEELESISVIDILRRGGVDLTMAALTLNQSLEVACAHGTVIKADTTLEQAATTKFDAVIIPGGLPGSNNCGASPLVGSILKEQFAAGKLIAAICAAPALVLAKHGILNQNIPATGHPGTEQYLPQAKSDNVVIDEAHNIITSRGPATAIDFALAILTHLTDRKTANKVAQDMLVI